MAATTSLLTVDDAVATLRQLGRHVRSRGRRRWLAQCPAHDDNRHSLSLREGERQPLLLKCHAGCEFSDLLAILRGERAAVPLSGHASGTARPRRPGRSSGPVHWYQYRDEAGRLLYEHGRTPDKQFPFRMPGARRWGLEPGLRRVLYRLPELAAARPGDRIVVVEGEKDADRLAGLGLPAVSADSGAGKWPEGCDHLFAGLHVAILPDNDEAGRRHAALVAARLAQVAASVRVVALPGLPEKGDVSDWLDAGQTVEAVVRACLDAPLWKEEAAEEAALPAHASPAANPAGAARQAINGRWPAAPGGDPDGFVATLAMRWSGLAPLYNQTRTYREDARQRHRWVVRHGEQVLWEEEKINDVLVLFLTEDQYERFKNRQYYRRQMGERREWWGVPQQQAMGEWAREGVAGVVVFHTDAREGGERVPATRPGIYRLIESLVAAIPDGRNPKGTEDWGGDYRTGRGDGRNLDETLVASDAAWLVALNEVGDGQRIADYRGMRRRTVKEIKKHAGEAPRRLLLGMLRDELRGKRRKTVLALLQRRIRLDAIQLWSRGSIHKAARALGIRLDRGTLRGSVRLAPDEAYRRLLEADLNLFTRTGRSTLRAFLDWLAPENRQGVRLPVGNRLRDSAQERESALSEQNPVGQHSFMATWALAQGGDYAPEPP